MEKKLQKKGHVFIITETKTARVQVSGIHLGSLESIWDLEADVFSEIWERRVASFKCQEMVNKTSNGLTF